jgi:NitT/TauT family transport system ATP-binding protein
MIPQGSIVALRGVSKAFPNGTLALRDLDLEVREGEFLTLLGPSGCGKSTVLRMIAGLSSPTQGTLEWSATRPDIGFVFQEPTLMPWASVFDNVWLPLRLANISRRDAAAKIEASLALVGLSGFEHAYPRELSGGMRMRVSIARALVLRPPLLLMDEPFAALDEITRFKLNNDLLKLKAELGTTVIFVTHSVFESVYLSTRIAVFAARPGRISTCFDVPEPLPRGEDFRLSPVYADYCRRGSTALEAAMREGAKP